MGYTVIAGWSETHQSEHEDFDEAVAVAREIVATHPQATAGISGPGVSMSIYLPDEEKVA